MRSTALTAAFAGYDAFISYAREDAAAYARALQSGLGGAGLVTFVDYQAIPPGEALRRTIGRGVRRSRLLIVVATPAAMRSPWVALEVAEGLRRGRKVVVINVGGAYVAGTWQLDPDLVWVDETSAALTAGQPSTGIVEEILKRVAHTRRQTVVVRTLVASTVVLIGLLALAGWNWRRAVIERETALAQKLVALSNTESLAGPQVQERVALLLLESLRRRETPEAIGGLAAVARLLRPTVTEIKAGSRVAQMFLSPDGSLLAAIGTNSNTEGYLGVWESATLQRRWVRTIPAKATYGKGRTLTWSSDHRYIFWPGVDSPIDAIDAATGTTYRTLAPASWSPQVAASPDGRWIATAASRDGEMTVWNAADLSPITTVNVTRNVLALEFSPDSTLLAFGGGLEEKTVGRGYEDFALLAVMATGAWETPPRIVRVPHPVDTIAFGLGGRALILLPGLGDGAHLYDTSSLTRVRTFGEKLYIPGAQFSPTSRFLLTVSSDRAARLWHPNGYQYAYFPHPSDLRQAVMSADERWIATASADGAARVWAVSADNPVLGEAEKRRETLRLGHGGSVSSVAFDRSGSRLFTASHDGHLRSWALESDLLFRSLPTESVLKLAIAPDGQSFVTAGSAYEPRLWAVAADAPPRQLTRQENDLSDVSYSDDGRWLATSDSATTTLVSSTDTYTVLKRFPGRYSAVGRDEVVTSGNGRTLQRFALPSGERLEESPVPAAVWALAMSSDRLLAAVLDNGTIVLRDLTTRPSSERVRLTHDRVRNVAFSPAGDRLASTGADGTVRIWNTSGQLVLTLTAGDPLTAVAFDRTGTHVAAGGPTGAIVIWNLATREAVSRFTHSGRIVTLAFTPTGPDVLFAGGDGGITSTPWHAVDLRRAACARLSRRVLTAEEWQRFVQAGSPVSPCEAAR
jgi:WD40 repeat protein